MLRQVYEPLLELVLPELCQRCGCPANSGFCSDCRSEFAVNAAACSVCGAGPLAPAREHCVSHPAHWQIRRVIAPLIYAPPAERYLQALKYRGQRMLGRAFGQMLAAAVRRQCPDVDALVSVPLHPGRLRERGFNQALEIARTVAAEEQLPILRTGIRRTRATLSQAELSARRRCLNLAGAFAVSRRLNGLRLAIVDDVITTGSTVNALADALLGAGAAHVEAWAIARTQTSTPAHRATAPESQLSATR